MKRALMIVMCLFLLAGFAAGCGSQTSTTTDTPKQAGQEPVKEEKPNSYTADQVLNAFTASGLPVVDVIVYDSVTDPNSLLGRPGQYTGKINFNDSTQAKYEAGSRPKNMIEVFSNTDDRDAWEKYVQNAGKIITDSGLPGGQIYMYKNKNIILRLDFALTPDQAAKYEAILKNL